MVFSEASSSFSPPGYINPGIPFSWNHGQCCCAGSRIFVQSGIYDKFLEKFTQKSKAIKVGDPFSKKTDQGPQVSKIQFDVRLPFSLVLCRRYHYATII